MADDHGSDMFRPLSCNAIRLCSLDRVIIPDRGWKQLLNHCFSLIFREATHEHAMLQICISIIQLFSKSSSALASVQVFDIGHDSEEDVGPISSAVRSLNVEGAKLMQLDHVGSHVP